MATNEYVPMRIIQTSEENAEKLLAGESIVNADGEEIVFGGNDILVTPDDLEGRVEELEAVTKEEVETIKENAVTLQDTQTITGQKTFTSPTFFNDGYPEYGYTAIDGYNGIRVHGTANEDGSQPPTIYGYGAIEHHKQDGTDIYLNLPNKNSSYAGTLATTDDIPTEKINLLERALFPAGTKYTADITDEYNGRTTADGENVLDGTLAVVKTVEGDTAACENLFNVEQNLDLMQGCLWEEDTQTLVAPVKSGYAFMQHIRKFPYPIPAGTKVSITAFFESGNKTGTSTISLRSEEGTAPCVLSFPSNTDLKSKTYTTTAVLDAPATSIMIFFNNTVDVTTEIRVRVVINIGDAPKMFTPFYTGLKNASFQGITSTGRNLFDIDWYLSKITATKISKKNGGLLVATENYQESLSRVDFEIALPPATLSFTSETISSTDTGASFKVTLGCADGTRERATVSLTNVGEIVKYTLSVTKPITYITIGGGWAYNGSAILSDIQIRTDGISSKFEPYMKNTLVLPTAVDLGYGTVVDFENQQIVENYGSYTFTGEEEWSVNSITSDKYVQHSCTTLLKQIKAGAYQFGFCDRYPLCVLGEGTSFVVVSPYEILLGTGGPVGQVYFTTPSESTLEELQALTKGMTIRYPLATPIITPFTDAQKLIGKTYTAYNHGMEMVVGNTNEDFTKPTITQNYVLIEEV